MPTTPQQCGGVLKESHCPLLPSNVAKHKRGAVGSGTFLAHYHTDGEPWAVGPPHCSATLLGSTG